MGTDSWWPAVLAVAAWPAGVVVIVVLVLILTRADQQAAVLRAIAEIVRAVRGAPDPAQGPAAGDLDRQSGRDCRGGGASSGPADRSAAPS